MLCESRGGRPGFPVPNSHYGLCGRKPTLNLFVSYDGLWVDRLCGVIVSYDGLWVDRLCGVIVSYDGLWSDRLCDVIVS